MKQRTLPEIEIATDVLLEYEEEGTALVKGLAKDHTPSQAGLVLIVALVKLVIMLQPEKENAFDLTLGALWMSFVAVRERFKKQVN